MAKRGILCTSKDIFQNPLTSTPVWHVIDAKGHVVGRLALMVSKLLTGRHKPVWDPSTDCGDYVVIINARYAQFTGKKFEQKYYKWHTGYPGGLKKMSVRTVFERNPTKVLHHAIMGMIPKNKLKPHFEKKLKLYADDQHPHASQVAASALSPIQRDIPVNERFMKHMSINEEELNLVGGKRIIFKMKDNGEMMATPLNIPSLLERARLYRQQYRLAQAGELKQFYVPSYDPAPKPYSTVPYDFQIGETPDRLRWAQEKKVVFPNMGSELWDWPKPGEAFEDNPEQLGRIMTRQEINEREEKEKEWDKEDKWRLVMRLTRTQMIRAERTGTAVPEPFIVACREIPTQFIIDEKDNERRMREALGLLEPGVKNPRFDAEFGDFSFGGKERDPADLLKPPTPKAGAKPAPKK